jgi:hypothetical protein
MIEQAKQRSFELELVVFDSWYSGLPNLKLLRSLEWHWLTQLKSNREVSLDVSTHGPDGRGSEGKPISD